MAQLVKSWVAAWGMIHTMSSGDDQASNGRVETEVRQVKRHLRLTLAATKPSTDLWPGAICHVGEERLRGQLQSPHPHRYDAIVQFPGLSQGQAMASVWHAFFTFQQSDLIGPVSLGSSRMGGGGLIQHAHLVMVPDPKASELEYELELEVVDEDELPRSRLVGKQPPPGAIRIRPDEVTADPPLNPDRAGGGPFFFFFIGIESLLDGIIKMATG